jgi:hypothetical protein
MGEVLAALKNHIALKTAALHQLSGADIAHQFIP